MSVSIKKVQTATRTVTEKFVLYEEGVPVERELTIKFTALTPRKVREAREQATGEKNELAHTLASILIDADLVDEEGAKVEPTLEVLESLDVSFLQQLYQIVQENVFPKKTTSAS
jgi:hypothetical protein